MSETFVFLVFLNAKAVDSDILLCHGYEPFLKWDRRPPMNPQLILPVSHSAPITSVAVSPDGAMLITASYDWSIKLWKAGTGSVIQTLKGHQAPVAYVIFSPVGRLAASSDMMGNIILWDVLERTMRAVLKSPYTNAISSLDFSRDGRLLLAAEGTGADFKGIIRLWGVEQHELLLSIDEGSEGITRALLSDDAQTIWSGGKDRKIKAWDVRSARLRDDWEAHSEEITSLALSPRGNVLMSGGAEGIVKLWDIAGRRLLREVSQNVDDVAAAIFSPSGDVVVTGGAESKVFDAESGQLRLMLEQQATTVRNLAFSPRGDYIVGIGDGDRGTSLSGDVMIWRAHDGTFLRKLKGHFDVGLTALAYDHAGSVLISANDLGGIAFWSTRSGAKLKTTFLPMQLKSLSMSPDGIYVAAGGAVREGGSLFVLDKDSGNVVAKLPGSEPRINAVDFSLDGRCLASVAEQGTLRIWSVGDWQEKLKIEVGSAPLASVLFSKDGSTVFAGDHFGNVKAFDSRTGELIRNLKGQTSRVHALALSPDGKLLASSGVNTDVVTVWHMDTGNEMCRIKDNLLGAWALSFRNEDEVFVATANGRVLVLSLTEQRVMRVLDMHDLAVSALVSWPQGPRLWSAGHDYAIHLIDVDRNERVATLIDVNASLVGTDRNLKPNEFLAIDPNGFYDASRGAESSLLFYIGGLLAPLIAFRKQYRRPKRVAKALALESRAPGAEH